MVKKDLLPCHMLVACAVDQSRCAKHHCVRYETASWPVLAMARPDDVRDLKHALRKELARSPPIRTD